jgi:Protein of unknown function (DUF2946)
VRRATRAVLRRSLLNGVALLLVWALSAMMLHPMTMLSVRSGQHSSMQHAVMKQHKKAPQPHHSSIKNCEFCFASNIIAPPAPPRVAHALALVTRLEPRVAPHFPGSTQSFKKARAPPFKT